MKNKTISEIVNNELCTSCGNCVSFCPKNLITLTIDKNKGIYIPKINNRECDKCGICYKVCPGDFINYKEFNLEIFGREPDNPFLGNFSKCFVGHSKSDSIRHNSTSGGLITQILIHALEEGVIDGALVTRMKKEEPLEPEPFIARSKEEIIAASKSKYCPVPVNLMLKEIINSENQKFAVVGLPCHLQGIIKAQKNNKKLNEKIVLLLGIFCSHVDTFKGTEFLIEKSGLKINDINHVKYRGNGWPGSIKIKSNESKVDIGMFTPLFHIFHTSRFFINKRCMYCYDFTSEFADISFGDAWFKEIIEKDKNGCSSAILRSENGKNILMDAQDKGKICLSPISPDKLIDSQKVIIHFKKTNIIERAKLGKIFNKKLRNHFKSQKPLSFYNKPLAFLYYLNYYLGSNWWFLIKYIPLTILSKYFGLIWYFSSITQKNDSKADE